jgi:hypothetical protein
MSSTHSHHSESEPNPLAELFTQLSDLFQQRSTALSPAALPGELNSVVGRVGESMSATKLATLRRVVHQLAAEVDRLAAEMDSLSEEELGARDEDRRVQSALRNARGKAHQSMTSADSVAAGEAAMAQARQLAQQDIAVLIQRGELINSAQLQERLGVSRQAISGAVKAGRLFVIIGPGGENFYPDFYADPKLDRRSLEKVIRELGSIPAWSKLSFLTSISVQLKARPLEALRAGRVDQVLRSARAFAES